MILAGLIAAMQFVPFNRWLDTFQELLNEAGSSGMLLFISAGTVAVLLFVPVSGGLRLSKH